MGVLSSVSVIAELERCGWSYEFVNEAEIRVRCPFHEDDKPSCSINVEKQVFKCQTAGCQADGDFLTFLAKALKTTRRVIFEDISARYGLENAKLIDPEAVERYHAAIWEAKPFLKELRARAITDELVRQYRIGFHGGRIMIPITNESGLFVNVRRYLPGAAGADKMKNTRGRGSIRLFPVNQLKYDSVLVCGGELKAILAADMLNEHGWGAITTTAGEGNWDRSFSPLFKNKRVVVMFDVDEEGAKAADDVCAHLKRETRWLSKLTLPLDVDEYPHGDINDWVANEKGTAKQLLELLEATEEWEFKSAAQELDTSPPIEVHLADSVKAEMTGRRISVRAIVAAMDTAPYVVSKTVKVSCSRDDDLCALCPIFVEAPDEDGLVLKDVNPESAAIIEMVATHKIAQKDALKSALRMPDCSTVEFLPTEYYNVEDVRLSPQLEIASRASNSMMQPALCIGHGLELNESYIMTGRMFPHPKTQQSVILISNSEATQDALSNYEPSDAELETLRVFQPKDWSVEGIQEKLDEVYADFEANVTRIFLRRDLHLMVDLAYHSPMLLEFDGRVQKGWTEVLIMGDSSQGKSETVMQLQRHYGLGEKMECKNATVAGLLGGLQQMGTRWFVTWGIIPTHDRRLVILEELKGASTEVIGRLTDMRSSGVAEIPKIEKRRTHARTRLIAISNPRSDSPLSTYNFGVEAVRELIGGLEDIRRFDAALLVSATEIDATTLNDLQRSRPAHDHRFTSELCRRGVLWSWTRSSNQVVFSDEARSTVLDEATRLCGIFSEQIPLVDRGSMRFKIARLAAALACRTFSTDDTGRRVLIHKGHIDFVSQFLDRIYSSTTFGYRDFSASIIAASSVQNPEAIKARLLQTPFPADFIQNLMYTNEIELRDISDWCGWEKGDALQLLSFLVRKHALTRLRVGYRKTSTFIELLKTIQNSKELQAAKRPDHVGEEF